ncbi:MAG: hypothetical protein K2K38_04085 [Clostridia bacterium]|nr:hypothetical protein [Clostridia bacterium]
MKSIKRLALLLCAAFMLFAFAGCNNGSTDGEGGNPPVDTSTKLTGKVYIVGDSTVCDYTVKPQSGLDDQYLPRYGYGTQLHKYLNCDPNQIINLAASGRSSLDYKNLEHYTAIKNNIGKGDYLIIGFGHNDEKDEDPSRYTNPNKSYTDDSTEGGLSFQYNLYQSYIKMARDAGATPILCTPIVRYDSTGSYTGKPVHITDNGDYPKAIKELGEATSTTVIDLTAITKKIYSSDNNAAKYYLAHNSYEGAKEDGILSGMDGTHINMYGAKMVCYEITRALLKTNCPLKDNVITNAAAPTWEIDFPLAVKDDYVKTGYKAFTHSMKSQRYAVTAEGWYGTAMGNLGGNSLNPFTVSETGRVFTISAEDKKGKIFDNKDGTSGGDGFAAAFMQVGSSENFTATAKAKVIAMADNAGRQSAFGLMVRDDIYIDTRNDGLNSTYLAAGVIDNKTAIFSRESKLLHKESNSVSVTVDAEYGLKIQRVGQKIYLTVTSGDKTFTKEYSDLQIGLKAVDTKYMYICLFATRGMTVQFSNVSVEITGSAGTE